MTALKPEEIPTGPSVAPPLRAGQAQRADQLLAGRQPLRGQEIRRHVTEVVGSFLAPFLDQLADDPARRMPHRLALDLSI